MSNSDVDYVDEDSGEEKAKDESLEAAAYTWPSSVAVCNCGDAVPPAAATLPLLHKLWLNMMVLLLLQLLLWPAPVIEV
jgi:hypothetical protein